MSRNHASFGIGLILSIGLSGCGGGGESYAAVDPEQQKGVDSMKDQLIQEAKSKGKGTMHQTPMDRMRASMIKKMR